MPSMAAVLEGLLLFAFMMLLKRVGAGDKYRRVS